MIGVALLAIIFQIVLINIRFLHLGRNNFLAILLCVSNYLCTGLPTQQPCHIHGIFTHVFDAGIVISFTLAVGHNVGRVFLNIVASPLKWLFLSVEFVNKDDPEKIRNALTASAVSLYQSNNNF